MDLPNPAICGRPLALLVDPESLRWGTPFGVFVELTPELKYFCEAGIAEGLEPVGTITLSVGSNHAVAVIDSLGVLDLLAGLTGEQL